MAAPSHLWAMNKHLRFMSYEQRHTMVFCDCWDPAVVLYFCLSILRVYLCCCPNSTRQFGLTVRTRLSCLAYLIWIGVLLGKHFSYPTLFAVVYYDMSWLLLIYSCSGQKRGGTKQFPPPLVDLRKMCLKMNTILLISVYFSNCSLMSVIICIFFKTSYIS